MRISDCTQQNTGILLTTKSNVKALALLVSGPTPLYQLTCTVKSRLIKILIFKKTIKSKKFLKNIQYLSGLYN